jgi:3-oxoacyl-[acyl-carrier protein] reductase
MDLGIAGRRAIVPASSGGLGLATAAALAAESVHVAICGRDQQRIERAAATLGGRAVAVMADVATPAGALDFVDRAERELGGPANILVINGPGPPAGDFAAVEPRHYAEAVDRMLVTAVSMCDRVLPAMRAARWGRIVAITSIAVRQPIPDLILSNTARSGVTAYVKTLAPAVIADGITVSSVQPGLHGTERVSAVFGDRVREEVTSIPAGRLGDPADFGACVAFLCSTQAQYLTGAAIPVDGGLYRGLQ